MYTSSDPATHWKIPATHHNPRQQVATRIRERGVPHQCPHHPATHCKTPATHLQHTCNTPATGCNRLQHALESTKEREEICINVLIL